MCHWEYMYNVHLEPINNAVSDTIIIVNYAIWPKEELCSSKLEALWANGAPYELIKNSVGHTHAHIWHCNNHPCFAGKG